MILVRPTRGRRQRANVHGAAAFCHDPWLGASTTGRNPVSTWGGTPVCREPRLVGWPRYQAVQTEIRTLDTQSRSLTRVCSAACGGSTACKQRRNPLKGVAPGLCPSRVSASTRALGKRSCRSEAAPTTTPGARETVGGPPEPPIPRNLTGGYARRRDGNDVTADEGSIPSRSKKAGCSKGWSPAHEFGAVFNSAPQKWGEGTGNLSSLCLDTAPIHRPVSVGLDTILAVTPPVTRITG